ncbi:papilin-like isoform X2 [Corticium candelabrum]|nr:papilin-like isoform X2 [Corticium candelabrum]XP_062505832.1 papilin-like isoform X2 [Corticium candelabrum]
MLRKLHLAISRSYSTHNTNDHISLLAVFVCLSSAFALSDLNDIRNYFAGEISSVQVEKELFDCSDVPLSANCSSKQTDAICSSDQACRGTQEERYSRCCFNGCQNICMLPAVVDWIRSPNRDSEPGLIVAGPEAPDLGELCSLDLDAEATQHCPHGYVCKEDDGSDPRVAMFSAQQESPSLRNLGICIKGDLCSLLVDKGICQNAVRRYYYDSQSNSCKGFDYGGCGGNDNNFETEERCRSACEKSDALLVEQEDKELFFAGEPTVAPKGLVLYTDDPCILTDCNSTIGERCVVVSQGTDSESDNDNKMPVCTCNYPCPEKVDPVCASNNRQYDNECLMEKSMCSNSVILSVKYHGPCYDPCVDVHCEQGQHCVSDYHTRRATCECISTCNSAEDSDIVCGSNGKWYPSFCWMNFAACKTNMTLSVEHRNSKEICGNVKPGSCPDIELESDGVCQDHCSMDDQCDGSLKCCFNGCQHHCVEPVFERDCEYLGQIYKHAEKFSEGCSECSCKKGRIQCSFFNCIPDNDDLRDSASADGNVTLRQSVDEDAEDDVYYG